MTKLRIHFDCAELPLSVSYRCAQLIVREARNEYTTIEPHPNAPLGAVREWPSWSPRDFNRDGVIVCRNSAPLIKLAFSLLSQHIPCQVLGRDIGQGLVSLIKKLKPRDISHLESRLSSYLDTQTLKLQDDEAKLASLTDKVECVRIFAQGTTSIDALVSKINSMFTDKEANTILPSPQFTRQRVSSGLRYTSSTNGYYQASGPNSRGSCVKRPISATSPALARNSN